MLAFMSRNVEQETGRYLVLQSPAEWPGAGRIQVNRIDVGDENVNWAPQGYWQSFRIPRIIRHVEFLKQDLFDTRKGLGHQLVGPIDRNRRIVVVERAGEPESRDRRSEPPAEMTQPLDEMRGQPEIVRAQLPVVFALAECRIGKGLAVGIYELVSLQLLVKS